MGSSSMIEIGGGPGLLLRLIGTNFWEVSTSTEMMMMMMMMMVSTSNLKLLKTNTEKILPKNPWFQCSFLQVKLGPKLRVFGTCKDKIPPKRLLLETSVFHPPIFFRTHVHMGFDHWVTMSVWNHFETIPHICHGHTDGVRGEKICHVEKFQISVHETCGES